MPKGKSNRQSDAPKSTNGEDISKLEAVRRALRALGSDAKPLQIRDFSKLKFGLDLTPQLISNYKTIAAKQIAGESGEIRKSKERETKTAMEAITLDDVRVVKEAIDRLGAEKVRELTKVLAK